MRAGFTGVATRLALCSVVLFLQDVESIAAHDEPLSRDELATFRKEGFTVVRNLVPPSIIAAWRDQLWSFLGNETGGADPNDPRTWPSRSYARHHRSSLHETAGFTVSPAPETLPSVANALHQLAGPLVGTDPPPFHSVLVNWPVQPWNATPYDEVRLMDEIRASTTPAGHIDRFPPPDIKILENYEEMVVRFQILLADFEHEGGSTKYYNRSHLEVHDYFQRHPEQFIYGSDPAGFKRATDWNEHTGWSRLANSTVNHGADPDKYTVVPYEFTGQAGDAVFWHPLCMHDGSINLRQVTRETVVVTIPRRFDDDESAGLPPRDYAKRPSDLFAGWPVLHGLGEEQCRQDLSKEH